MKRLLTVATLVLGVAAGPSAASACGGFFCGGVPMDQSGERVLFGVKDGNVQAHIQIFYQGEADKFAWVLPLPHEPTNIAISSDTLFQQLDNRTRPNFNLNWANTNNCYYSWGWGVEDGDFASGGAVPGANEADPGVTVLQEAEVGPYDAVVIQATGTDKGAADAVFKWLNDNGYDQPEVAKNQIHTYVAENHVFVAIKLQSDQAAGDITPLALEFPFPASCVPLRLTSIAATDDMDVWVYMLGDYRAVPVNYFHVEVNEKRVDWLNYGSNYSELAKEAVDRGAGRAFMTEYAGDTLDMQGILWRDGLYDLDALVSKTTPWDFMDELLGQNFPRNALLQNIIREFIPKPESLEDLSDQQFYNNLSSYQSELAGQTFDVHGMVAKIQERFVEPLKGADQLFTDHRYMTRMYTVISPGEMTRDPIFLFNPDLGNVSNVHRATAKPYCQPGSQEAYKVVVTLDDGSQVEYEVPEQWQPPVVVDNGTLGEAASAVQRMYTSGPPEEVSDAAVPSVDQELDTIQIGLMIDPTTRDAVGSRAAGTGNQAGCTASGNAGPIAGYLALAALVFGSMMVFRRREDA